jgi:prepilin-type N-terminal cleavage/methylation domain-containing protein/prepilin-type processing-associated H-X9-DG protein
MGLSTTISRRGFTLVELLVVITIIGTLVGLLLPAVQAAVEAGRASGCRNNLKQIGSAMQQHEAAHGTFPAGGWGCGWVGDADRGSGLAQPGGWIYNILEFMDARNLHDLGIGTDPTGSNPTSSAKMAGNTLRNQTPVGSFLCPSRRAAAAYPYTGSSPTNCNLTAVVAKTDYAANGGDLVSNPEAMGIWSDSGPGSPPSASTLASLSVQVQSFGPNKTGPTGMVAALMMTSAADVKDGLANTYLVGEKYVQRDLYFGGLDAGDNYSLYIGDNPNITRYTYNSTANTALPPMADRRGMSNTVGFGSAHSNSFNACMGDGSVRPISYSIDPLVHQYLGNKADGQSVSPPE